MEVKADKFLDCTGVMCPMVVVKTKAAVKPMATGEILEMVATDPGAIPDIQGWAEQTQNELLLAEEIGEGKSRFLIRKAAE